MDGASDGPHSGGWWRDSRVAAVPAGALDTAWVLIFVVIGRSSHTEGLHLAGVARTAWPFLVGLAVGWVAARAWRSVCVTVGMVLRAASGQGVVPAFIAVALAFVGLGLLGWRALAQLLPARGLPGRRAPDGPA